jgi:hypothetical protein
MRFGDTSATFQSESTISRLSADLSASRSRSLELNVSALFMRLPTTGFRFPSIATLSSELLTLTEQNISSQ